MTDQPIPPKKKPGMYLLIPLRDLAHDDADSDIFSSLLDDTPVRTQDPDRAEHQAE